MTSQRPLPSPHPQAYAYTSVTSVQLLDCSSIPAALLCSRLLLGARFGITHYVGVAACVLGAGGMALADVLASQHADAGAPASPLLGDILVLAGGALYGVSNVWQERLVRRYEGLLYLGCVGCLGAFISGVQLLLLERRELAAALSSANPGAAFGTAVGFALCMYALYALMPVAMTTGSAVLVNLSLLTADLYALFVGVFLFGYAFHPLYFVAYAAIVAGLATYAIRLPRFTVEQPVKRRFLSVAPTLTTAGAATANVVASADASGSANGNGGGGAVWRSLGAGGEGMTAPRGRRLASIEEGMGVGGGVETTGGGYQTLD